MKRFPTDASITRRVRWFAVPLAALALCACSVLQPKASAPPAFYALEYAPPAAAAAPAPVSTLALIVNPVRAASGFDSQRIIYMREPHKLEYFARSEWIDAPARMLGPLLVAAVAQTGAFKAVVLTPGSANGDLRLDTEIIRLQQEFQTSPSSVRFTLRAYLVDEKTRRVVAWKELESQVPAASDTPQGGVAAANRAVQNVLETLAQFVVMNQSLVSRPSANAVR